MTMYDIEAVTLEDLFRREADRQTSLAAMAVLLQATLAEYLALAERAKLDPSVPSENAVREAAFNFYFGVDSQLEAMMKPLGKAFKQTVEAGLAKRAQGKR